MKPKVSVIICTYNPDAKRLSQTLNGLRNQTLPTDQWELIIVDNNSDNPITADLSWHPNYRVISESKPGLTYARLKGFAEAKADMVILVDDDNILANDYLAQAFELLNNREKIAAAGGKISPQFEAQPPIWINDFYGLLALRDHGDKIIINQGADKYPDAAPVGAGMVIRKAALDSYIQKINDQRSPVTDRKGQSLSSGGDNDMVLEMLKAGWQVGYFPSLSITHIIPESRTQVAYLARLNESSNASWIKVLRHHGINPWPGITAWTVPLRTARAWITHKAWLNPVNYIKWRGAHGMFKGLASD